MRKPTKESELSTEPIGQNLIKLISNVCFSVFVLSVLIFTAIAITYQPPDPWLESAPSLTKLFTQTENATFKTDDSIIKTGEDLLSVPAPAVPPALSATPSDLAATPPANLAATPPALAATPPALAATPPALSTTPPAVSALPPVVSASPPVLAAAPPVSVAMVPVLAAAPPSSVTMAPALAPNPVAETMIEMSKENISNSSFKSVCEELKAVNCSDPRFLLAVKKFNLKTFKSIVFLEYQTPVKGTKPDECDVFWRFRNKKEKSWRKYRDFRRFQFGIGENCTYKVMHTGRWHSGINARPPRIRPNTTRSGGGNWKPKLAPPVRDDETNDTVPTLGSETNFRKGKYLYYARGGDYCKGMNQYLWSFLCGLGEAMYLNRTFVMDLSLCLSATYSSSNRDEGGKDLRFYFDFEHLKETASIVGESEFLRDWKKWDKEHKRKVPVKKIKTHKVTPMQLKKDKSTIIWRQFDVPELENYWYRVCEGQAAKYIHRPWHAIWKSKRLMNIVTEISGRMDWDFDALHVVRGAKAQNKQLWPHLDSDSSPDAILTKVKEMVQPWRNLYIATNEPFYNYFDNLRSHYKVHLLDDYKELWSDKSEWYNETTMLNNGNPVEFDGYMRVAVDTEVLYRSKIQVETFYNLSRDCKDGINTC
ncbi:uncharacterized protein LOC120209115 isoform X2 [Hibiscus syriacus]|uniref:uncharacterized protein LOC120209115 isoform X2 n=1 Tax=Hibiscus syriacus TaxID=106335 RepID=UPI001920856B|nr:uncharacterized protein LOC120209115 isoform X2 [Hibiscus syriacus]